MLVLFAGGQFFRVRYVNNRKLPVKENLLRSPGESLRKEMEKLNELLILFCTIGVALPVFVAGAMPNPLSPIPFVFLLSLATAGVFPALLTLKKVRLYGLGLSGERAVGEELNRLMLEGYHVFHDYPAGPTWNIDHIAVGPSGVYAIETKTCRKQRPKKGGPDHEIIFDGKVLRFPCWTTTCGLEQARNNAARLTDELSKALAEPIHVKAVLTFPGWFVRVTGKSDVSVLNPKQIHGLVVSDGAPKLSSKQIEQIAFRIEEKCRDVEF